MRRAALLFVVVAVAAMAAPSAASAGTYIVKVCHTQAQNDTPGATGGWSTLVGGTSFAANAAPAAWLDVCLRYRNNIGNWAGIGGAFGDTALAGSYAFVKFVPPAGSSIVDVAAFQELAVTSGSFGEAGMFAVSGRALADNAYFLGGGGEFSQGFDGFGPLSIGADGAQGLMFGGRCPAVLPPLANGYCGGAGTSVYDLEITVEDPSGPSLTASVGLDAAGRASLVWSGGDPQSGIATTSVTRAGSAPVEQELACNATVAPPCPANVQGTSAVQLGVGETVSFTVSISTPWGGTATKAVAVTRPGVAPTPSPLPPLSTPSPVKPTPPPRPTPAATLAPTSVTLNAKTVSARRLKLSGYASGCTIVTVTTPGGTRRTTVKVTRGKWSLTVPRKRGAYRARCGTAATTRSLH
jgi:hypothetical protein